MSLVHHTMDTDLTQEWRMGPFFGWTLTPGGGPFKQGSRLEVRLAVHIGPVLIQHRIGVSILSEYTMSLGRSIRRNS